MADVLFIAITIAFFALCVSYVQWCDRIIGPDEFEASTTGDLDREAALDEIAA